MTTCCAPVRAWAASSRRPITCRCRVVHCIDASPAFVCTRGESTTTRRLIVCGYTACRQPVCACTLLLGQGWDTAGCGGDDSPAYPFDLARQFGVVVSYPRRGKDSPSRDAAYGPTHNQADQVRTHPTVAQLTDALPPSSQPQPLFKMADPARDCWEVRLGTCLEDR